jgi:signal transduction histidine kinase
MKVVIPYKETQAEINKARAVLIAVAVATVFLSMVVLYLVVRYVVVNPLKHLRMVSDEISRGNLETRADIRTGDEFQALADSFNRMLRHLTDSQAGLQKLNVELDEKVDELAQLNIQLYQMNQLKGDFLANMSHELRTPLNSIIGFSEVLVGIDSLTDKQRRYAQNIQKSGRLLLDMINDILDLAKMEAGKMEIKLTEFSIDKILEAQCDMVRSLTEEKNIDLNVVIEPDLPLVFQDQGKIQQILTNLLSNAIKFTPEGGRITVSAQDTRNRMLEIKVADTGVGIPMNEREVIFEKFRQGRMVVGDDNLTRKHSGTGLGLSIVRELCKLLGGEVTVESEVGKGSTFTVLIPWSRAEVGRGDSLATGGGTITGGSGSGESTPAWSNSGANPATAATPR